jgi:hypothetical protein
MISTGTPRARVVEHRNERPVVEGSKHDPVDAAAEEVLHHLDLLVAIVLADRPLPDHLDTELARSLDRARVHRLPVFVGGALGNDGKRLLGRLCGLVGCLPGLVTAATAAAHHQRQKERPGPERAASVHGRTTLEHAPPVKVEAVCCPPRYVGA